MNEIKVIRSLLSRMFSTKRNKPYAGVSGRLKLMNKNNDEAVDIDDMDPNDLAEYESDFMNIGKSHVMHEREMRIKKENLKKHIVKTKYFTEKESRFLTYAEKDLIYKLYKSNPEKWTIEKLSESFPALPQTIVKILHAKWSPKSVENVLRYDNVVLENWKMFRAGKLPVNPALKEHLMKFKNRKIILTDRESLVKQFVPPKIEFKKPRSQLFSSIIQNYLQEKEKEDTKLLSENSQNKILDVPNQFDEKSNLLPNTENMALTIGNPDKMPLNNKNSLTLKTQTNLEDNIPYCKKIKQPLTFNEFVNENLQNVYKESPEEGISLLNTYRKQKEVSQQEQAMQVATVSDNAMIDVEENTVSIAVQKPSEDTYRVSNHKNNNTNIVEMDDNLMDTGIKLWNKKTDTEMNYAKPIKITKSIYKLGMSYRINDCYYDDDGEFLYRVPGVQS